MLCIVCYVCAFSVPLAPLNATLIWPLDAGFLSFRERIAECKCDLARSHTASPELFPHFRACRPLDNNLNIVTSQYTHVKNVFYIVREMSVPLAHLTMTLMRPSVAGSVFLRTDCSV